MDVSPKDQISRQQSLWQRLRRRFVRRLSAKRLRRMTPGQVFDEIYRRNAWQGTDSLSGLGSDRVQTRQLIAALPELFARKGVHRILDVPCGDFHWMSHVDLSKVDYIGADIVPELIEANRQYAKPGIEFRQLNLLSDALPEVDLVLCRDCLVHFSFDHIALALANIAKSSATYLLTTTFVERGKNDDIATGRWRPINLEADPIALPAPEEVLIEGCTQDDGAYPDKALGLWRVDAIAAHLRQVKSAQAA